MRDRVSSVSARHVEAGPLSATSRPGVWLRRGLLSLLPSLLLVLLPILLVFCAPQQADAYTWVVDYAGTGDNIELQPVLDSAIPGDTVLILPGVYFAPSTGFDMLGKELTVISSDGPEATQLDFSVADAGFRMVSGEGPESRLQGVTLQSCYDTCLELTDASPSLQDLRITSAFTFGEGAGIRILGGAPTLQDITFTYATAYSGGGSVWVSEAVLELSGAQFYDSLALNEGGGIKAINSALILSDVVFRRSYAAGEGGAIALLDGSTLLGSRVRFLDGTARQGAGIYLEDSSLALTQVLGLGNRGQSEGFLACLDSQVALTNATLVDNASYAQGGAISALSCGLSVDSSILAFNRAPSGGALAVQVRPPAETTPTPEPSPGLLADETSPTPDPTLALSITHSVFWENGAEALLGVSLESLLSTVELGNQEVDPGFLRFQPDLWSGEERTVLVTTALDDLHLLPGSALRDAGNPDPLLADPDGSRNDVGYTGGPLAEQEWSVDADGDGLPDGWEVLHGLDSSTQDGQDDPDQDGLTSAQEYALGLLPALADSDGDLLLDGVEVASSSDPSDAFSPEASLILPHPSFPTVQSALDAARGEVTIVLQPGTYSGGLDTLGKPVTLRSQAPDDPATQAATQLDGLGSAQVLSIGLGEGASTRIEGLTLRNGLATAGGCLWVSRASPVLKSLRFDGCEADQGGALFIQDTSLVIEGVHVEACSADEGGAIWSQEASVHIAGARFDQNEATGGMGGSVRVLGGRLEVVDSEFLSSTASEEGGAIRADTAEVSLVRTHFMRCTSLSQGGAISLYHSEMFGDQVRSESELAALSGGFLVAEGGQLVLQRSEVVGAEAGDSGGGLALLSGAQAWLQNVLIQDAKAGQGAGLAVMGDAEGGDVTLDAAFLTMVGNQASVEGAQLYVADAGVTLRSSILAFSAAPAAPEVAGLAEVTVDNTLFYGHRADALTQEGIALLGRNNQLLDPLFQSYVDDLRLPQSGEAQDDLHLRPDSPAVDGAAPEDGLDPDGSTADCGYYGGPLADPAWSQDPDGDGLPSGWETAQGLDPQTPDAASDSDGDGLTALQEYNAGTYTASADSDQDGLGDAQELAAGSDARNPFDPSGEVRVPGAFVSIQAAINAAPLSGRVRVGPGTWRERLDFLGKQLDLSSDEGPVSSILDGQGGGSVVHMHLGEGPDTRLAGFTITGGQAEMGGGLRLEGVSPRIEHCVVQGNQAQQGAGVWTSGAPFLQDVQLLSNQTSERGYGGGLYATQGKPVLERVVLGGNTAFFGGGLYVTSGQLEGSQVLSIGNQAGSGAGVGVEGSSTVLSLVQSTLHANSAGNGAGAYVSAGMLSLVNAQITGNLGPVGAGIDAQNGGRVTLRATNLWSNHGANFSSSVEDAIGLDGNVSIDPRYEAFSDDGVWTNDTLRLRPDSPLKDAGVAGTLDPDGSPAESGVYGGETADWSWYFDADRDGIYDGWEAAHGLDPTTPDAQEDVEADGLDNATEFLHGLDPQLADSDGDSFTDAAELDAGTDGAYFFSPVSDVVATDYFPTLQAALNAARDGVTLRVPEGEYRERLDFRGKQAALIALGKAERTRIIGDGQGSVVVFRAGETRATRLEGFTLQGGQAVDGGGIRVAQASPTLHRLIIRDNVAENNGGGISIASGEPLVSHSLIVNNSAAAGGGIAGLGAVLILVNSTLADNVASGSAGGVRCVDLCTVKLVNSIIANNVGGSGAGVTFILPATLTLESNDVWGNLPDDYSGVVNPTGRNGNIKQNPDFAAPQAVSLVERYALSSQSRCVDAGQDASQTLGPEIPAEDLVTLSRGFDGNQDGVLAWDMGALELELDVDGDGFLESQGDCAEGEALIYPGAPETCDDGFDQDCDGLDLSCLEVDDDGDGRSESQGDCDDTNPAISPDLEEVSGNGLDDNCDGDLAGEATSTPEPEPSGGCTCQHGVSGAGVSGAGVTSSGPWGMSLLAVLFACAVGQRRRRSETPHRSAC